jgi:tRNA-dihydrouridine synthase B
MNQLLAGVLSCLKGVWNAEYSGQRIFRSSTVTFLAETESSVVVRVVSVTCAPPGAAARKKSNMIGKHRVTRVSCQIYRGKTGESTKFQVRAYNPYFCAMKIGSVILPGRPLVLAPMEDVTDAPFRLLCKRFGVDLMFSEFVASEAVIRKINKTLQKMEIHPDEHPYGIQLYGKNVDAMVESARIAEQYQPDLIDLNFGCPVKKIAMKGAGAGLLRDVPQLLRITEAVVKATSLPVTVKTRLGWDDSSKIIAGLAEQLQDTGIAALTIHGRTRAQMYLGEADWTLIGEVKNNPRIHIPIIGNGDIDTPQKAKDAFDRYGVDAVMVGRAAIGRPWLFRDMRHFLDTGEILPPVLVEQQVELVREHVLMAAATRPEVHAIHSMRRFFSVYFKGLPDFKEMRVKLLRADTFAEVNSLLDQIVDRWGKMPAWLAEAEPGKRAGG